MIKKIVYSLWSKPNQDFYGFNSEKNFIECFALSYIFSKRNFEKVELVTDLKGESLIVDKYGFKFDSISTELESINYIDSMHWAIGKIYACKIQKEPFLHIDNDVILFKGLPSSFLKMDSIFQSFEGSFFREYYSDILKYSAKSYANKPIWHNPNNTNAYNCGILGFNNLSLLETWWQESLNYIKHVDLIKIPKNKTTSLIFEQVFIYELCNYNKFNIGLLSDFYEKEEEIQILNEELTTKIGYTHLISNSKRDIENEKKISKRLMSEDIDLFFNIKKISEIN